MANDILSAKIASPYANALLDVAKSQGLIHAITSDMNNLRELLDTTPDLVAYLNSPVASPSAKKEIIKKVITPQVSKETSQFLMILTDRNRISYLQGIATAYLELVYELANIRIVEVSSASKLTDQQQDLLIEKLETMTNAREVKLVVTVDSTLLGGFLIKTNSQIIDLTVKGQLSELASHLDTVFDN